MSHQNHRISTKFLLSTSLIFIFLVTPNNQINAFDFKHTNKNITEWQDLLLNQLLSQGVDEDNLKKADKLINAVRQHLSKGNKTIVKSQLSQIGPALGKLLLAYDLFEKLVKEDYANVAWDSMSLIVTETMTLNSITLFSGAVSATGVGAILTGVKTTYDSYKALEASKRGVALERFLRMVQFDPQLRDKGKMPSVNSKMVERFLQVYVIQNRNDGRALTKEFVETVLQGTWPDVFRSASWWERFAYDMDKGQAMYEGDAEINQLKSYIAAMLKDIFRMYEIRQRAKETYEKMREQKEMLEAYQKIVMYLENQIDSTNPDWAVKKYDELIKKGPGLLAKKRQGNGDYLSGLRGELSDFSSDLAYLQRHLSQSGLFYTNATAMLDKLNSLMKSTQEALNEVRTRYQSVMDKELTAIYKDVEAPWPDFEFDIPDVVVNCLQNVRERNRNAQRPWELKLGYAYYLNEEWRDKVPSHNGLVADFSAYEKKTLEDYLEERDRLQEAEGQAGSRHEAEKIRARIAGLNKAWDSWRERNQKIYATKSELITELPWTCRQEAEFFASMLNAMQEEVKDLLKVPEYGFNSNELNNAITICAWIAEFVKNNQPYTGLGSTAFEPVRQASSLREVYDALDDIIESMGYEPPEEANDYDGFISVGEYPLFPQRLKEIDKALTDLAERRAKLKEIPHGMEYALYYTGTNRRGDSKEDNNVFSWEEQRWKDLRKEVEQAIKDRNKILLASSSFQGSYSLWKEDNAILSRRYQQLWDIGQVIWGKHLEENSSLIWDHSYRDFIAYTVPPETLRDELSNLRAILYTETGQWLRKENSKVYNSIKTWENNITKALNLSAQKNAMYFGGTELPMAKLKNGLTNLSNDKKALRLWDIFIAIGHDYSDRLREDYAELYKNNKEKVIDALKKKKENEVEQRFQEILATVNNLDIGASDFEERWNDANEEVWAFGTEGSGKRAKKLKEIKSQVLPRLRQQWQKKQSDGATNKVKELYKILSEAYRSRDTQRITALLSEDWSADDGSSLYDVEDSLENTFSVFDEINMKIVGLRVQSLGDNRFEATYTTKMTGRIYDSDLRHDEESFVTDTVVLTDRGARIERTSGGAFWR